MQLVTELLQAGVSVDTVGGKLKHTPLMLGKWGSRVGGKLKHTPLMLGKWASRTTA